MTVSENQLDTWAKQGSITQSQSTYATVRSVLLSTDAPYKDKSFEVFLQGSYGNDTNIFSDSDVDIVIRIDSVYYDDTDDLEPGELAAYKSAFSSASYSYNDFKKDVLVHLQRSFPGSVTAGKKAIFIKGNGTRRDTDVLVAAQFRKYTRFTSWSVNNYVEGICFWTPDGTRIVNYPKLHSENCTTKHQDTNKWFKPSVRILKNMRNSMISNNLLPEGLAPSYFLEGMLYNVPLSEFGSSYVNTISSSLNYIKNCNRGDLVCANEQYYLCHPTSPVTWRSESLQKYLNQTISFWNAWGS